MVDDHLALPDLRVEYEDTEGRELDRDIEVVTRHHHGSHLAGKHRAGFRLMRSDDGSRKAVYDDHHIGWI